MVLPYLPPEIVRKIYAYNIPRHMDQYDPQIARMYNINPRPVGSYTFLCQFMDHESAMKLTLHSYGLTSDFDLFDQI